MKQLIIYVLLLFCIQLSGETPIKPIKIMQVTVWDTYVTKKDGSVMHFDIIAPETTTDPGIIHNYGKDYLILKGQKGQPLSAKECRRCHVRAIQPQWVEDINKKGYYILEMENCN